MIKPRLITDRTPEILEESGRFGEIRSAKDDAEFFNLLKEKTQEDFNRLFESKNVDQKIQALADLETDLLEYKTVLVNRDSETVRKMGDRITAMGGFKRRFILDKMLEGTKEDMREWTNEDVEFVRKEGEAQGYPRVIIGRNPETQKPFAVSDYGKEVWEKMISLRLRNDEISQDHFLDFVNAVKRKDYVQT